MEDVYTLRQVADKLETLRKLGYDVRKRSTERTYGVYTNLGYVKGSITQQSIGIEMFIYDSVEKAKESLVNYVEYYNNFSSTYVLGHDIEVNLNQDNTILIRDKNIVYFACKAWMLTEELKSRYLDLLKIVQDAW